MPRYAVVVRFYIDLDTDDVEIAHRRLKGGLEGLGAKYLGACDTEIRHPGIVSEGNLSVMRVLARTPHPPSESTSERRERYLRRKAEREEAHRRNRERREKEAEGPASVPRINLDL